MSGIVFHGVGGLTDEEIAECRIFDKPTLLSKGDGTGYDKEIAADVEIRKVHDKIQSEVAKKLRRDQYRLQPAKMILSRAKAVRERSALIIEELIAYKATLVDAGIYTNVDINNLIDSKYDELYKTMNNKLDLEFPCNEEAKK